MNMQVTENEKPFLTEEGQEWLRGVLRTSVAKITFKKKDGTERVMNCTLQEDKLPVFEAKNSEDRKQVESALAVFDMDKQSWRSFRWDSITSVEFSL
jgi:hypothetical protein